MPPELKRNIQKEALRMFGVAGTWESDDGQNFHACTWSNRGTIVREQSLLGVMGLGHDAPQADLPGTIGDNLISDTALRGFYRFYSEIMQAPDWGAIKRNGASGANGARHD